MTTASPRWAGETRRAGPRRAEPTGRWKFTLPSNANAWNALWAMMIGFFMIMVDSTIVAVANPTIMADLHTGYASVVWVTSAYLLGYAVVLLVAGRLGDRFGTKNLYLAGLALFTAASLWCGLSGSVAVLITARVVQGIGAGVLTPQTLSTITRIFPPERRGVAVSLWGATAGVATLVGPLAGGALVGGLGWEWIFFVNVPIGVIGLGMALWLVPALPTQAHRFDLFGVALSGIGMFLIVFGLQEGQAAGWQPWIWAMIVAGVGCMSVFVYWQAVNTREPLIPLDIFADRDFSLCSAGVAIIAFATTATMLPLMFYTQAVCGLSPMRSALVIAPMAVANGVLAPFAGVIVDRYHPRPVLGFGFSIVAIGLTWLVFETAPDTPIWRLLLPFGVIGVGSAFVWSPLTATATRNLPPHLAGAGSAVYNSVRQLGAVLGSAAMAAFMTWRIGAQMPARATTGDAAEGAVTLRLPGFLREPFSAAMSQSLLLPAFIALFGIVAALFLAGFAPSASADEDLIDHDYDDDDDYVEFILRREPDIAPTPETPMAAPRARPIGFARNGSHVDAGRSFRPMAEFAPPPFESAGEAPRGQHYRRDPDDDPAGYGRHSSGR